MTEDLPNKIKRAAELLATSRHISVATVNEDGSPHNSPVRFVYDPKLEYIYWASNPESLHSQNIKRTGKIFAALYDRKERGGLYIESENADQLSGKDLEEGLKVYNDFLIEEGVNPVELSRYLGNDAQSMWGAKINKFWVNCAQKDEEGNLKKDGRVEIAVQDILNYFGV